MYSRYACKMRVTQVLEASWPPDQAIRLGCLQATRPLVEYWQRSFSIEGQHCEQIAGQHHVLFKSDRANNTPQSHFWKMLTL